MLEDSGSVNVQPLTGIRVIDLTRVLSGPFSTMLLADMGADVIKIETPHGDTVRGQGELVNGLSWYFASFNRNKRSVVLDLRQEEARALLARLLADAGVGSETSERLNEIAGELGEPSDQHSSEEFSGVVVDVRERIMQKGFQLPRVVTTA